MMDAEQKAQKVANEQVLPWQAAIGVGDCFREDTPYGFDIYGTVLEEYEEEAMRYYKFCYCFSVACPEGEKGDVHMSVISELISGEEFERRRRELQGEDVLRKGAPSQYSEGR